MQDDSQEFEKLRKLLALKRHEVPPPGYFRTFSQTVIRRIETEQSSHVSLWQQVVLLFRTRPAISWSFSVALVMTGLVASTAFEKRPSVNQANSIPSVGSKGAAASATLAFATNQVFGPAGLAIEPSVLRTNGEPKLDSLFSVPFYHQVQPASYTP